MGIVTGYLSQLVSSGIKLLNNGTAVSSSNPLPVAQTDGLSVSGTATSAAVLFTTSMLNYESITVQTTSAGTSCIIIYETSDGNSNWIACSGLAVNSSGNQAASTTSNAATMLQFSRKGLYFRARVLIYGSGTVTVIGTLSKTSVMQIGAIYVAGSTSSEGNTAVNPITIAAEARTSSKTGMPNASIVRPIATTDGRLVTRQNSIPENEWQYAAASGGITDTTNVALVAAQGAGIKNYLTGLSVANADAIRGSEIVIKDGASTVIWRMYLDANAPIQSIQFVTPLQSSENSALNVACITTGTKTYVNAQGYKAP